MTAARNGIVSADDLAADITGPRASIERIGDADGPGELSAASARAVARRMELWEALSALLEDGEESVRDRPSANAMSRVAIAQGVSSAEIAARLYVSTATLKAAVSRILTKLGLTNRTQIAVVIRDHSR